MVEVGGRMRSIVLLVLRRSQQYLPPSAFPFEHPPFRPPSLRHSCYSPQRRVQPSGPGILFQDGLTDAAWESCAMFR